MYLRLTHGRAEPDAEPDPRNERGGWGTDGPYIGPLGGVRVVYGNVHMTNMSGDLFTLADRDGCLYHAGRWYGDADIETSTGGADPVAPCDADFKAPDAVTPKPVALSATDARILCDLASDGIDDQQSKASAHDDYTDADRARMTALWKRAGILLGRIRKAASGATVAPVGSNKSEFVRLVEMSVSDLCGTGDDYHAALGIVRKAYRAGGADV